MIEAKRSLMVGFRSKGISFNYIDVINDIYNVAVISVRTTSGSISEFPITIY